MGFLKDINQMKKMGNQMRDAMPPPGERLAQATATMQAQTAAMTALANGEPGTATIVSAAQTGAQINFNPVVHFELLVTRAGAPPYPATAEVIVPQIYLARAQPGAVVAVKIDPADASKVAVDWNQPV